MPPRIPLALATLLLAALAPALVLAEQDAPPLARPRAPRVVVPAEPALTPPTPVDLNQPSAATPAAEAPPAPLPAGLEMLPEIGWRVRFANESREVNSPAVRAALAEIGRHLAAQPQGRVRLLAQASGPVGDVSTARRLTLARALAVKQALVAGGLAETRIDVRPLGHAPQAEDLVDILPPDAPRQTASRPTR